MNIDNILSLKGHDFHVITQDASLTEIAHILHERNIGFLIVQNGKLPISGVLSERDVIKAIGQSGEKALSFQARHIMQTEVITCSPEEHPQDILQRMDENKIRHMPVLKGNSLRGVISIRDIVQHLVEHTSDQEKAGLWARFIHL